MPERVSSPPGRRPRGTHVDSRVRAAARCSRAKASASAQVDLALAPARSLRVPTSTTTVPGVPLRAQASRATRRRAARRARAPGARPWRSPMPSARCTWRSRGPSVAAISIASEPAVAVCDRSSVTLVVGLRHRVPVRAGRPAILAVAGARQGNMFSTARRDPGLVLAQGHPVDEVAGVVALPPERRVQHHRVGAHLAAPARSTGRPWPTGRCPRPAGSAGGSARGPTATGMPCSSRQRRAAHRPPA